MPKEIEIDGEKQTVYTEDEVKPLRESIEAQKADVEKFTNLQKELGLGEGQSVEDKIKQLKEEANPKWREFRGAFEDMKKELKKKGVEVGEDGKINSNEKNFSMEEINKIISEKVSEGLRSFSSTTEKATALSGYSEDDRKKIEPVLDRLMALGGDFRENLSLAVGTVFPGRNVNSAKSVYNSASGGGAPAYQSGQDKTFDESDDGKEAAASLGLSFSKKKAN